MINTTTFNEVHLDTINFLADPVGSGKTTAAIEHIHLNTNESHIFVSPTKLLAKDIEKRMKADLAGEDIANNIKLITGDTIAEDTTVYEALKTKINEVEVKDHHILIITTQGLRGMLPTFSPRLKSFYNLYLDEGIDALDNKKATMGKDRVKDLLKFLDIGDDTGLITIKAGFEKTMKLAALGDDTALGDDGGIVHTKFVPIAKMLTNGLHDVYGSIHENSIRCVGMLRPDSLTGFKSVTMIVAMFEQSLLAKYWRYSHGIKFTKLDHDVELCDTHKQKGPLISIYHMLDERDCASRAVLSTRYEDGRVIDYIVKKVESFFNERHEEYCYSLNDYFKKLKKTMINGKPMPTICAGLNSWEKEDNVAALATVLPETWAKDIIIKLLGEDGNAFYSDWRLANTYQTIGRCSLRVREAVNPITVVVLSYEEAMSIKHLFQSSKMLGQLGDLPFIRQSKRAVKNNGVVYVPNDHSAYSKYENIQKANDNEVLDKLTWYKQIREPRMLARALIS